PPAIYPLSLPDALPILGQIRGGRGGEDQEIGALCDVDRARRGIVEGTLLHGGDPLRWLRRPPDHAGHARQLGLTRDGAADRAQRSEEHTSELQSRSDLV